MKKHNWNRMPLFAAWGTSLGLLIGVMTDQVSLGILMGLFAGQIIGLLAALCTKR